MLQGGLSASHLKISDKNNGGTYMLGIKDEIKKTI